MDVSVTDELRMIQCLRIDANCIWDRILYRDWNFG